MKTKHTVRDIILGLIGLIWLFPVYLLIVNACKSPAVYDSTRSWIPDGFAFFSNIATAWTQSGIGTNIASTVLYAVVSACISVLIGGAAGYAIIALRIKHGFAWFVFIFGATVIPLQMIILPLFNVYSSTGLFDTKIGLIIAFTATSLPFASFVMRNFFMGVSHSVFEAATVDGASSFGIFWRIYLPIASSALVAVFILQATGIWNDLMIGMILSQSDSVRPIVPALNALLGEYANAQVPVALAAAVLISLPTIALFFCTQRYFSKGLALGQY